MITSAVWESAPVCMCVLSHAHISTRNYTVSPRGLRLPACSWYYVYLLTVVQELLPTTRAIFTSSTLSKNMICTHIKIRMNYIYMLISLI